MDVWWRETPFSAQEKTLFKSLLSAHYRSAFRSNSSSLVVAQAAAASGDLAKAIAAGILATGGRHAPLEETYEFLSLDDPASLVPGMLGANKKVPGWGGTFQKDEPDPIWKEVSFALAATCPVINAKIEAVTSELHEEGKQIYPNPSAYTAATAIALGLPAKLVPFLFIEARLSAWTQIAAKHF